MAEDRVAVFRRFHEAWTSGRLSDVLTLVDPDVVARPLHRAMFTRSEFRGREGIEDWFREMTDPWDRFETLVEDVKPTSTGAIGLLTLVGYRGDSPFHARVGVVCDVREGRIVRLTARNASDVEKEMKAA